MAGKLVDCLIKTTTDNTRFFEDLRADVDVIQKQYQTRYAAWGNAGGATAGTAAAGGTAAAHEWKPLEVKTGTGGREPLKEISDLQFTSYLRSLADRHFETAYDLSKVLSPGIRAQEFGCIRGEDEISEGSHY